MRCEWKNFGNLSELYQMWVVLLWNRNIKQVLFSWVNILLESVNCSDIAIPLYWFGSSEALLRASSYNVLWLAQCLLSLFPLFSCNALSYFLELGSLLCPMLPLVAYHPGLLPAITFPLTFSQKKSPLPPHSWSLLQVSSHGGMVVIYVQVCMTGVRQKQNYTVIKAVKTDYIQDYCSRGKETLVWN